MPNELSTANLLLYGLPFLIVLVIYLYRHRRTESHHAGKLAEAKEAGLTEPPSLHPVIDPRRCLSSRACV